MTDELQATSMSAPSEPVVNIVVNECAGAAASRTATAHRALGQRVPDGRPRGDDPRPRSAESIAAMWEPLLRGEREDWLGFAIYALPDAPDRDRQHSGFRQPARYGLDGITIGDVSDRGQDSAPKRLRLLLDYAFTVLGVHNVWLDTPAYNAGAIRAYEKAGFREIGRRRARERWPERATT